MGRALGPPRERVVTPDALRGKDARMNVYRLYHREGAGRPRRVRWALEEAGAPYEWVVMDDETGHGAEHARRHPLGRVPVLESDDGLVYESAALCLHVADLNPAAGLISAPGTHDRAVLYQWSFYAMTELEPAMIRAVQARRRDDAAATAAAEARLVKAFAALGEALGGSDYVTGDRFTIADVVVGGVCMSARQYDVLPESTVIAAYLERLDARPAKQRAFDD
jgi:glutathione S-transferase